MSAPLAVSRNTRYACGAFAPGGAPGARGVTVSSRRTRSASAGGSRSTAPLRVCAMPRAPAGLSAMARFKTTRAREIPLRRPREPGERSRGGV